MKGFEYTSMYQNGWNGVTYLISSTGKFGIGLLNKTKAFLDRNDEPYTILDSRKPKKTEEPLDISDGLNDNNFILRDYQEKIVQSTIDNDRGIVRAATGSGKCSSIDSLHITEHGLLDYAELESMIGCEKLKQGESTKLEMTLATPLTDDKTDKSAQLYFDGYGQSRKIITKYGFELTATHKHKIKILDSNGDMRWEKVGNLKPNDFAAISYNNQLFGKDSIPLDEAYWYGLLIGNGCLNSRSTTVSTTVSTNMDNHILDFSKKYLDSIGVKCYVNKTKSKAMSVGINSVKYREKLNQFGFTLSKSINKTLPINIRKLNKECLAMVIRGIYETDGWVEEHSQSICLGLSNKKLIDQIHLILLNFGVVASRRMKKTTHEDCHILTIYKEFVPKFLKEIGLDPLGHKFKKIMNALTMKDVKQNSNVNLIHNQNEKIQKIINNHKKDIIKLCPIKWNTVRSWSVNGWRTPSKENLLSFITWFEKDIKNISNEIKVIVDEIKYLCENDCVYLPIQNIEETKSSNYDFFIPETHSFASQGFINHNTLCIAQSIAKINKPTIVYVIGLDLLSQFHTLFSKLFKEKIGYIGNGTCDIQRINIASIWTIGRSLNVKTTIDDVGDEKSPTVEQKENILKLLSKTKVHIFDECHIMGTATTSDIYKKIDPEHMYGFSGTPYRDDGSDLLVTSILGDKISDVTASELIEKKVLAKPIIKFFPVPKMRLGTTVYAEVYREYIVENEIRNNLIINRTVDLLDKGYNPLMLFKHISHGNILKEKLEEKNIKFGFLSGKDPLTVRNTVKKQLEDGEIQAILASTILDIGFDLPKINSLVLCGGGKSAIRATQRIGRCIRMYPGKEIAAVIDFYDQAKFLKNHSLERCEVYESEPGFQVIKCSEML